MPRTAKKTTKKIAKKKPIMQTKESTNDIEETLNDFDVMFEGSESQAEIPYTPYDQAPQIKVPTQTNPILKETPMKKDNDKVQLEVTVSCGDYEHSVTTTLHKKDIHQAVRHGGQSNGNKYINGWMKATNDRVADMIKEALSS